MTFNLGFAPVRWRESKGGKDRAPKTKGEFAGKYFMPDLEADALKIAKYMYEHKHTAGTRTIVSKLKEAVALSPQDFELADDYLNEAKYVDGTMGGDAGRWLTSSGIQFVTSRMAAEKNMTDRIDSRNVFVVHGQDNEAKESVARFLHNLDLVPIILHEQPNSGRTIIEKFEHHSNKVGFAVVLLTPDDLGSNKNNKSDLQPRARQNVIFELGYFFAKLKRENVCALHKQEVETPSDIHGVVYVPMDESGAWKYKLAKEMKQAGLNVDMNKI